MSGPTNAPKAPSIAADLRESIRGDEYRPGATVGSPVLAVTRVAVDAEGRLGKQARDVIGADRALVYELPVGVIGT